MAQFLIFTITLNLALLFFSAGLLYAEGELAIEPGKYKLTKTTKTNFDSVPVTRTTEECITDPTLDPNSILPNRDDCKIENLKSSENSTSFDFICKQSGNSSTLKGRAEYSANDNIITSNIRLEGLHQGKELIVESSGKGQRIGDCFSGPEYDN